MMLYPMYVFEISYLKFVKTQMALVLIDAKFHGYSTTSPVHQCN